MTSPLPVNRPFNDLYIYYLKGYVDSAAVFGADYIGNWQEEETAFLFFNAPADGRVDALVCGRADLELVDRFVMTYADWHGGEIRPFTAGSLRIEPPWAQEPSGDDRQRILLDPGVVFGAGNHPTTRDCLAAIEMVFDRCPAAVTLDLGTGTGLLALAAARLGSPRVLAVDLNYLAVRTTRDNIALNGMADRVLAVQGRAENFLETGADLLIANIHYDVMKRLVGAPGFSGKQWIVLSGLLRSEARDIEERLSRTGAVILERWVNDGVWHTFLATRA